MKKIFLILGIVSACLSASAQTVNIYEIQNGTKLLINSLRNTDAKKYAIEFKQTTDTVAAFDPSLVNSLTAPDSTVIDEALFDSTMTSLLRITRSADIRGVRKFYRAINSPRVKSVAKLGNMTDVYSEWKTDSLVIDSISEESSVAYLYQSYSGSTALKPTRHYKEVGEEKTLTKESGTFSDYQVSFTDTANTNYTLIVKAIGMTDSLAIYRERYEEDSERDTIINEISYPLYYRFTEESYTVMPDSLLMIGKVGNDTVFNLTVDFDFAVANKVWNFRTDTYTVKVNGTAGDVGFDGMLTLGTSTPSAGFRLSVGDEQLISATFDLGANLDIDGESFTTRQAQSLIYSITSVKATVNLLDWMKFVLYTPNVLNLYGNLLKSRGVNQGVVSRINRLIQANAYYPGSDDVKANVEFVNVEHEEEFGYVTNTIGVRINFLSDGTSVMIPNTMLIEFAKELEDLLEMFPGISDILYPRVYQ